MYIRQNRTQYIENKLEMNRTFIPVLHFDS